MKPRFIISKKKVLEQYNQVVNLGCKVSYSKKTNPSVWKILEQETDCDVGCHSLASVNDVKDKKRIWYFTLAINDELLNELFALGVDKFVVDNPEDLNKLLSYINNNKQKIDLLLRMKVKENTIFTGKYFVFGMNSKFVNQKIAELRSNQNIKRLGIHFHRKSQNVSEWSLKEEMESSILPETLKIIDILNIGGGMPGKYKNSHDRSLVRVMEKIKELRNWLPEKIELFAEPGRFIAGPSAKLECEIIAVYDNNLFVNFSIYNGALDTIITNVKLIVEGELKEGQGNKYIIKGKTPCSLDILRYNVWLKNPKVGDKIVFLNAGAYNYTTDFCGLKMLETVIIN